MLALKTPEQIIDHLRNCVFVRPGASSIAGVGVIAIREIPAGTDPFCERELGLQFTSVPADLIADDPQIPDGVKRFVTDMMSKKDGRRKIPVAGFNSISPTFLLNHSETPNIALDADGFWITLRQIQEGEELTVDYRTYNDADELAFEDSGQLPLFTEAAE